MANRIRGEVPLELAGQRYTLCLTLGALAELEGALKAGDLVGLAERLFSSLDRVLRAVESRLSECRCDEGCPACIQSSSCLLQNEVLDKRSALSLLTS